MEDTVNEEFSLPDGYEIPESFEVAEQRVRDLTMYVWAKLPALFEIEISGEDSRTVPLQLSVVMEVVREIHYEFSSSVPHRIALMSVMGRVLAECVRPHLDHAAAEYMNSLDMSDEDIEETGGSVSGSLDALWWELYPIFDLDTSTGQMMKLASLAVSGFLNSMLWEDPSWDMVYNDIQEVAPLLFDYYLGAVGLLLICAYIRVTKFRELPSIAYYVS